MRWQKPSIFESESLVSQRIQDGQQRMTSFMQSLVSLTGCCRWKLGSGHILSRMCSSSNTLSWTFPQILQFSQLQNWETCSRAGTCSLSSKSLIHVKSTWTAPLQWLKCKTSICPGSSTTFVLPFWQKCWNALRLIMISLSLVQWVFCDWQLCCLSIGCICTQRCYWNVGMGLVHFKDKNVVSCVAVLCNPLLFLGHGTNQSKAAPSNMDTFNGKQKECHLAGFLGIVSVEFLSL